jgi:hypothetical protein
MCYYFLHQEIHAQIEEECDRIVAQVEEERNQKNRENMDNILQERVEYLEKRVQDLEWKLEVMMETIKHGQMTELKQETEEKQDLKNQAKDNKSGLSDSSPKKLNGNDSAHQVDMFEGCEVTVDVHCEDIKEGEDELKQIGKDDNVEETVLGCVEGVSGQEDKLEQIGENDGVKETVLVHEKGLQGEDSGMEAGTQLRRGIYNRRICRIGICVLSCAVGILLWDVLDGVCMNGV